MKLYMILLGAEPKNRLTEQHDIFFGIGTSVAELVTDMYAFWPDAGQLHVDSWREVTVVDGYEITVVLKEEATDNDDSLFFINLGGYKPGEFEEYHYKKLTVAPTMGQALKHARRTTFYKHYNFKGPGVSHVDDKYGVDVDNMYRVDDILPANFKIKYSLKIKKAAHTPIEDELHIGYFKIGKKPV